MYFQVRIHIKLSMVAFFLFGGGCATRFCYATLYCEQNGTKQHQFFEWIHKLLFHVKQCQKYLDMRRTQAEVLQTEQLVTKSDQPMMMLGGDGYKNTGWFGKGSLERYSASRVCFVLTNTVWTTINKLYLLICWWLSVNNKHSFIHEKLPGKTIHSHLLAPHTRHSGRGKNNCSDCTAWEVKLEIMTTRPTDQPTDRQTDRRAHRKVSLPISHVKDTCVHFLTYIRTDGQNNL